MICEHCKKKINSGLSPAVMRALAYCEFPLSMLRLKTKERPIPEARWAFWFHLVVIEPHIRPNDRVWSLPMASKVTRHHHTTALNGIREHGHRLLGTPLDASIESIIAAYAHSQDIVNSENKEGQEAAA
jgi:hypothetical protein